jgi:hypothetical protein
MALIEKTPGPWKQHHLYPTALVSEADPYMSLLTVDADGSALFLSEEDCKLAAASPDLLAFAQEFVEAWNCGMGGDSGLYESAKRAIAKATA